MCEYECTSRELQLKNRITELENELHDTDMSMCEHDNENDLMQKEINELNCIIKIQNNASMFNTFMDDFKAKWQKIKTLRSRNEIVYEENHKCKCKIQELNENLRCIDIKELSELNKSLEFENDELKNEICMRKNSIKHVQNCLKLKEQKLETVTKEVHKISCKLKDFVKEHSCKQQNAETEYSISNIQQVCV